MAAWRDSWQSGGSHGCEGWLVGENRESYEASWAVNMLGEDICTYIYIYCVYIYIYIDIHWSDPPANSGMMDFNCNFPAKIAQQPRDQNHKQFERPNLLNPNFSDVEPKYEITLGGSLLGTRSNLFSWSLQRFCWIKSLLGKGKGSSAGTSLLRDKFC